MDNTDFINAYEKIVAKAWSDKSFKETLFADPVTVFKEYNIEIPEGMEIRLVENTDKVLNFTFPLKPTDKQCDQNSAVIKTVNTEINLFGIASAD